MSDVIKDPWIVQPPKQTAQVPVGFYTMAFQDIEDAKVPPTKPDDNGERWRFVLVIKTGPEAGYIASALTNKTLSDCPICRIMQPAGNGTRYPCLWAQAG